MGHSHAEQSSLSIAEHVYADQPPPSQPWRGVRTKRYTYARWRDREGLRVLYDHKNDPLEMHNRINESRYAPVAAEMEDRLQRWLSSTADPFDTGPRLPATDMLDLGQQFTHPKWHDLAPREYVEALAKRKS